VKIEWEASLYWENNGGRGRQPVPKIWWTSETKKRESGVKTKKPLNCGSAVCQKGRSDESKEQKHEPDVNGTRSPWGGSKNHQNPGKVIWEKNR